MQDQKGYRTKTAFKISTALWASQRLFAENPATLAWEDVLFKPIQLRFFVLERFFCLPELNINQRSPRRCARACEKNDATFRLKWKKSGREKQAETARHPFPSSLMMLCRSCWCLGVRDRDFTPDTAAQRGARLYRDGSRAVRLRELGGLGVVSGPFQGAFSMETQLAEQDSHQSTNKRQAGLSLPCRMP